MTNEEMISEMVKMFNLCAERIDELKKLGVTKIPDFDSAKKDCKSVIGGSGEISDLEYAMYYTALLYKLLKKEKKKLEKLNKTKKG